MGRNVPLRVWGPSGATPELGTAYALGHMQKMLTWDMAGRAGNVDFRGYRMEVNEFDYKLENEPIYEENGVTIRTFPAIHAIDGSVSYSLEWNGLKFVFSSDTYPNTWFVEVIWGLGPVIELPSNTNDMGTDKWSAGAAATILSMPGNWVLGALVQNLWSVAGPDSAGDVNKLTFQYFINYNLPDGWYLTSTPIMTADWNKPSGERWTVPFGGGVGRLVKLGKQPVDFKLQGFSHVVKPDSGPHWSVMAAVKLLFPK
jgi:hypothetical protein